MADATSTGMRTEVLSPLSNEVRLILPQTDVKGTAAAKHPAYGSKHPLIGRYPDHVLVDIRPSGASGYVDYIYETLPTTPRVVEEIDPERGVIYKHIYRDQLASTLPVKGATALLGVDLDAGRYVYRAGENPIGGTLAEVMVVTVLPPGTLKTTSLTDEIHGPMKKYEQFVRIADSSLPAKGTEHPASSGRLVLSARLVDEDGTFATREIITVLMADAPLRLSKLTDDKYGSVHKYDQFVLRSASLPAIGDTYQSRIVLTARLLDDDGVFANLEVITSASTTGTSKPSQEIDQIFCVSKVVEQQVPAGTAIPERGTFYANGTTSGYVLDAKLKNSDGVNATIEVKLATANSVSFTEYKLDHETGIVFPETKVYTIGAAAPTGSDVNASGQYSITDRLGCNYWVRTTSKTTTLTTESYDIVVPASWPAVLRSFNLDSIQDSTETYVVKYLFDYTVKKAYNGPCRARVTRTWSKNVPTVATPTILVPEECAYNGIALQFAIPPCLHFAFTINETSGTNHPRFEFATYSKTFNATTYTDWPASVLYDVNIGRKDGGYIKEEIVVYAPS